ncbi:hypothetical protein CYMTET_6397 [Cymbomonas tetramitiformis]|uniref:Uncharacterized protein n=1 Tax=Cymbomonas tetramitiformis TaxID=36881 RepID=A0AAE0GXI3_9CHLO|nr:hypothetical protein CYMTET_6397 [Cymbomonas tetramitiformis]
MEEMDLVCHDKKGAGEECTTCLHEHHNDLKHSCEGSGLGKKFCNTTKVAPVGKCLAMMERKCPDVRGDLCHACLHQHHDVLKETCTGKWSANLFCERPQAQLPSAAKCLREIDRLCYDVKGKGAECTTCTLVHHDLLGHICKGTGAINNFCSKTSSSPSPIKCLEKMDMVCHREKGKGPACVTCIHEHQDVLKDICEGTHSGKKFCNVSEGMTPISCTEALDNACHDVKGHGDECHSCLHEHHHEFKHACKETPFNKNIFCNTTFVETTAECLDEMSTVCGNKKGEVDECHSCIHEHHHELKHVCKGSGHGAVFCNASTVAT